MKSSTTFLILALLALAFAADVKEKLNKEEVALLAAEEAAAANSKRRKTVEDGVKVYGHVHYALAKEQAEAKQRRKSVLNYDLAKERYDAMNADKVERLDADTVAMELKYEKVFTQLIKELGLKTARTLTPRALLFEVEKRMEQKDIEKRVKLSDRMLEYLKHTLMELNQFNSEGEDGDKFDMKKFVGSVFGKYRARHEEDAERVRRILVQEKHLQKDHNAKEHREEFHDQFYIPQEYRTAYNQPYLSVNN